MVEIGFWDYTCPLHGSLEVYSQSDWDILLDDMSSGGFNSLVLGIKWLTTGYASRYNWLDQDQNCTAISSKNHLVHHAFQGARKRGIRTWALVVATIFPTHPFELPHGIPYWTDDFRLYDLDTPGLSERIDFLFEEVVDLFGDELDGIVVELEFCDGEAAHRVPIYNAWAMANNRPDFQTIKNFRMEPRFYPFTHWRDFTTSRRIDTLIRVEQVIRSKGFKGKLASIIEIDNQHMAVMGNVNLHMLRESLQDWAVVTYDSIYDRRRNRLATMDFCIQQPRSAGLSPHYLTRGVMTFGIPSDLPPTKLEDHWQMAIEDARQFKPDALWFMGSDCRLDGMVCSHVKLPEWGFKDPRTARKRLMKMTEILK
jgi:hypothetical protein